MSRPAFWLTQAARRAATMAFLVCTIVSIHAISCQSPSFQIPSDQGVGLGAGGEGGQHPVDHCANGVKDEDETDRDCGGMTCFACEVGFACVANGDCENQSCVGSTCQDASCEDKQQNFDESDIDCGGANCGPTCETDASCNDDNDCRSLRCEGGRCQAPSCDDRILNGNEVATDCGGSCDGCPVGGPCIVSADCESPPEGDPAQARCSDGVCELSCPDDTGDCNQRASDGCEVDLLTTGKHCGGCGADCAPDHAVGRCLGGECLIKTDEPNQGCDENYADCNLIAADGCEANLLTDPDHCGACEDSACSTAGGTPSCSSGECSIECDEGFSNCDDNARDNGCEINTNTNTENCGSCGEVCEVSSGEYTAFCARGFCGESLCGSGKGDCDGDGDCSDSLATVSSCGGCGLSCSVAHGSPQCLVTTDETRCAIDVCDVASGEAWADCDGSYTTGCEVNTLTNRFRCGGCLASEGGSGEDCSLKQGTDGVSATTCNAGSCQVVGCTGSTGDCDGAFANGCEVNLDIDAAFCGSCNIDCTEKVGDDDVTSVACQSGSCRVSGCSNNRADCDGSFSNGCEVNENTSELHCGGCNSGPGTNCNAKLNTDDVTGVLCNSGTCEVTTCRGNYADCDGDFGNGCEVNTDTSDMHCGDCTTVCSGEPTCENGSCTGCPNGETACGASCVDTGSDTSHCGACGYTCSGGDLCVDGNCMPPCTPTTSGCEYQMGSDQVVIEAEHYFTKVITSDDWVVISDGGASGGQAMFVDEDNGTTWSTSPYTDGPSMNYQVNFTSTGTFNVWLRANVPNGTGDSCFVGIDGVVNPTFYDFLDGSPNDNTWQAWMLQTISVSTTGVHTVNIWAREDGLKLDKLVINKSSTAPTGTGPAESLLSY